MGSIATNTTFYADLPAFHQFEEVASAHVYTPVPVGWHVLITDIRGSTRAIEAGRYKDVNALGVSTIIAVVNRLRGVDFPYVFGGDGATLLIPPGHREAAEYAARSAITMARDAFDLELRAGLVAIEELAAAGAEVRVAKFQVSPTVVLAMLEGNGVALAESLVKQPRPTANHVLAPAETADLSLFQGFQCRWQPIPSRKGHIISLIVAATTTDPKRQRQVYRRILDGIGAISPGGLAELHPVDSARLALTTQPKDLRVEGAILSGQPHGWRHRLFATRARWVAALGRFLMERNLRLGGFHGAKHGRNVAANTDFRKFDGTLRMVLDLSGTELQALDAYLNQEQADDEIVFGLHRSDAALMTCFIQDFSGNHFHFVDGSQGGYALAAKQMKAQGTARRSAG